MAWLWRNIELYLSAAGIFVIFLVPRLLLEPDSDPFQAMAWTALTVGVLHGLIFWVVRRRQRHLRAAILREVRGMLSDRVNNQLTAILGHLDGADREKVAEIQRAVLEISALLRTVTDEALSDWRTRYANVLAETPLG